MHVIVDVCIELFNKINHLEAESSTMIYDLTSTYFGKDVIEKLGFADALFGS